MNETPATYLTHGATSTDAADKLDRLLEQSKPDLREPVEIDEVTFLATMRGYILSAIGMTEYSNLSDVRSALETAREEIEARLRSLNNDEGPGPTPGASITTHERKPNAKE